VEVTYGCVIPFAQRVVLVEVDHHDLEDGAVDEAVDDAGCDVAAEDGPWRQLGVVCKL